MKEFYDITMSGFTVWFPLSIESDERLGNRAINQKVAGSISK